MSGSTEETKTARENGTLPEAHLPKRCHASVKEMARLTSPFRSYTMYL